MQVVPTHREGALACLLDAVLAPGPVERVPRGDDPVWDAALGLVALTLASHWDEAHACAAALPAADPDDHDARRLLNAARVWGTAGDPGPASADVLDGALDDLPDPATALGRFTGHLLAEGLLAHGRLDLALRLAETLGDRVWQPLVLEDRVHPFSTLAQLCEVRLLAFAGRLTDAADRLTQVAEPPPSPLAALVAGTACLVHGNQAEPAVVRRLVAEVDRHAPEAVDHLTAGAQMLAAFGLIAIGDVVEAARRVLLAGGDDELSRLNVVDRGLGLEMLVALAVAGDDVDAAAAWTDRMVPLLASPIADSTVARTLSRLALAQDRPADAVAWSERAVARACEVGRTIEAAEGEVVLGRARIEQRGEGDLAAALHALEAMVAVADAQGHRAARAAAARTLRPRGVRMRPLSGSGWAGLSEREAEVARLAMAGAANREIAGSLHLSEHTVRAHVSRVLAAFGVATRAGLPAAAGVAGAGTGRPGLTARQTEVAGLVAQGLSDRAIGERLGLSSRTVEKHVGDILLRWGLPSRTAVAHAVGCGDRLDADGGASAE